MTLPPTQTRPNVLSSAIDHAFETLRTIGLETKGTFFHARLITITLVKWVDIRPYDLLSSKSSFRVDLHLYF